MYMCDSLCMMIKIAPWNTSPGKLCDTENWIECQQRWEIGFVAYKLALHEQGFCQFLLTNKLKAGHGCLEKMHATGNDKLDVVD